MSIRSPERPSPPDHLSIEYRGRHYQIPLSQDVSQAVHILRFVTLPHLYFIQSLYGKSRYLDLAFVEFIPPGDNTPPAVQKNRTFFRSAR